MGKLHLHQCNQSCSIETANTGQCKVQSRICNEQEKLKENKVFKIKLFNFSLSTDAAFSTERQNRVRLSVDLNLKTFKIAVHALHDVQHKND